METSITSIKEAQRFSLPNPKYPDGKDIVKARVTKVNGVVLTLRPLKQKGVVMDTQDVAVSPFLISRINQIGTLIFFKAGSASHSGLPNQLLADQIAKQFE